jgi:hypothetical protein
LCAGGVDNKLNFLSDIFCEQEPKAISDKNNKPLFILLEFVVKVIKGKQIFSVRTNKKATTFPN